MISTTKTFSPTHISLGQKKFTGLSSTVLPHLKCVDFIFGLLAMKVWNMFVQPSKDMVLIGDIAFYASHNHVGSRAFWLTHLKCINY